VPTYGWLERFRADFRALSPEQQARFLTAVNEFVDDLATRRAPRPGLRVKGVQGAPGIFELTWAPDGRATFEYGEAVVEGEPHILWRRVGTHAILARP